jgi:hypothetical protein
MKNINKPPSLYRDKTLTQDVCFKKHYYQTRSVTKAINSSNAANTITEF